MSVKGKTNPSLILVIGFAILIIIGAFCLTLPITTENGEGLSFLDAFFTATSATCVTGLVVVDTGDTFSLFGELVILTLIQVGGLGFMTFATLLFALLGKKVSLKEKILLKEAYNVDNTAGIAQLVKRILIFTIVTESVGALILAARFTADMSIGQAIYFGFFHAVSNFNNAGFDIMGDFNSLTGYVDDPFVVFTISALVIVGGIGFIVVNELYEYRTTRKLSFHSKVVISITLVLLIGATILIFLFEYGNERTIGSLSATGKTLGAFFQSVSPRTAGSNTLPIGDLTDATLFLTIFLMYIGGGSGSTAGGIKVSTFAVLLVTVLSQLRGREDIVMFKRRLMFSTILKAMTVALSGTMIVIIVTFILCVTEKNHGLLVYLFEATSAFGTVGLSMGLTPELSTLGRIIIIFTMFLGRLGPLTLGFAISRKRIKESYHYPKAKIMIG